MLRMALAACAALLFTGCGQQETKAPQAPQSVAPAPEAYRWTAQAPATLTEGPPVVLHLNERGYGAAILQQTAVQPGDTIRARFTVQGQAGRGITTILQRHCDAANGEDNAIRSFRLNGQPQTEENSITFEHAFSCVRFMVSSLDGAPLDVTIAELVVTRD